MLKRLLPALEFDSLAYSRSFRSKVSRGSSSWSLLKYDRVFLAPEMTTKRRCIVRTKVCPDFFLRKPLALTSLLACCSFIPNDERLPNLAKSIASSQALASK